MMLILNKLSVLPYDLWFFNYVLPKFCEKLKIPFFRNLMISLESTYFFVANYVITSS